MEKRLVDLKTAAEILSVSTSFLYKKVEQKEIDHVRLGRKVLFSYEQLERLIIENAIEAVDWVEKIKHLRK